MGVRTEVIVKVVVMFGFDLRLVGVEAGVVKI